MKDFRFDTMFNITQNHIRNTEIQLCPRVHRQVCCDKIPSITVKKFFFCLFMSHLYNFEVGNKFVVLPLQCFNTEKCPKKMFPAALRDLCFCN